MPAGEHISKRPSGSKQRKIKKAREKSLDKLTGSMLQYVKSKKDDSQSSSKEIDSQNLNKANDSDASMHSEEELGFVIAADTDEELGAGDLDLRAKSPIEELSEDLRAHLERDADSEAECMDENDLNNNGKKIQCLKDVSFWEIPVQESVRIEIVKLGSGVFQNKEGPFSSTTRKGIQTKGEERKLTREWFYNVLPTGEKILRSWMVYSNVSNKLYCFCCRLFTPRLLGSSSKFLTGFDSWWKLNPKIVNHESSQEHLNFLEKWKTLEMRLKINKTIDAETEKLIDIERKKWRDILYRLLDIILFLSKQNIPFRGHREDTESLNRGNFLELVELLSKYDVVLKEHLMSLKEATSKHKVSYLSNRIQNEFISLLSNHVKEKLINHIKKQNIME